MTESAEDVVNGQKVITREKAVIPDLRAGYEGKYQRIQTVDTVLLEDDTVINVCVHPSRGACAYTHVDARSVTAHQRSHGPKTAANRLARENAKLESELAARKRRQSDGGRRAAETRKRNRSQAPAPTASATTDSRHVLADALERGIEQVSNDLTDVRISLKRAAESLTLLEEGVRLIRDMPIADALTLEKARRYDILSQPITNPIK